jgi:uncharacterized low-complexity protein
LICEYGVATSGEGAAKVTDPDERLTRLEQKLEQAFALDARLRTLEETVKKQQPRSGLRDWLQTLGPYLAGLVVLIVGFWLKDSVSLALQREQLDLNYVKDVRDMIEDFDASTEQPAADANAIALAMYGKYAIVPLIERLQGGDVAQLAAERGLRLIGDNEPAAACPRFTKLLDDPTRRYTWQTYKSVLRLIGVSGCVPSIGVLEAYVTELEQATADPERLAAFAARFSNAAAVDVESADSLKEQAVQALEILRQQRDRATCGERTWGALQSKREQASCGERPWWS